MTALRVAVIQHDIAWEQPGATFAALQVPIATAAAGGARLVVLSEMFGPGFSMATERIAEPYDGPSAQFLLSLLPLGEISEHKHDAK